MFKDLVYCLIFATFGLGTCYPPFTSGRYAPVHVRDEDQAIRIATKKFKEVHEYFDNGGYDKLIGVEGDNESITVDGDVEFDDCTEH